ncbi:uncharacterized protein LOC105437121 [Strongylocentrotus purpuratus]|uniref:Uncharacterized protein n=1 Tax=Strongylocentrotus purpuratus TaxID=7668 RepID=A0A7M7HI86_STRPU|nr:uncharacterized protein LOC105437121 [Strongylocentrotus purpuratus]
MYITRCHNYHHLLVLICFAILVEICQARRSRTVRRVRTRYGSTSTGTSSSSPATADVILISCAVIGVVCILGGIYSCCRQWMKSQAQKEEQEKQAVIATQAQHAASNDQAATNHALSSYTQPGKGTYSTGPGYTKTSIPLYPLEMAPPTYNQAITSTEYTYQSAEDSYEKYRTDDVTQEASWLSR